jgi:putative transposase
MHELLDQILEADSQQEAQGQLEELASELSDKAQDALEILEEGILDATAVMALPEKYRKRLRTSNMLERLIQEVRRREKPVRIFPNIFPNKHLPKQGLVPTAVVDCWSPAGRKTRGMVP